MRSKSLIRLADTTPSYQHLLRILPLFPRIIAPADDRLFRYSSVTFSNPSGNSSGTTDYHQCSLTRASDRNLAFLNCREHIFISWAIEFLILWKTGMSAISLIESISGLHELGNGFHGASIIPRAGAIRKRRVLKELGSLHGCRSVAVWALGNASAILEGCLVLEDFCAQAMLDQWPSSRCYESFERLELGPGVVRHGTLTFIYC